MRILWLLAALIAAPAFADIQVITENTTVQNATPDEQFTGMEDTQITGAEATTNYGSNATISTYNDGGVVTNTLIRADLSNIPGGSTITSATLYLRNSVSDLPMSGYTVSVFESKRAWVEDEATWNVYSTGNNWETAGGTGTTSDREAVAMDSTEIITATWYEFDLTDYVTAVVEEAGSNLGVHLERTDGTSSHYVVWHSVDSETDGARPELVIDYTPGGGASIVPIITHYQRMQKR